mmetsp:Transcript_61243/g.124264  ORF Transcript_61243/g.124264 Transcript_61243/m.124264 type:complete len:291 (+) Transcript_61243:24-896(+)
MRLQVMVHGHFNCHQIILHLGCRHEALSSSTWAPSWHTTQLPKRVLLLLGMPFTGELPQHRCNCCTALGEQLLQAGLSACRLLWDGSSRHISGGRACTCAPWRAEAVVDPGWQQLTCPCVRQLRCPRVDSCVAPRNAAGCEACHHNLTHAVQQRHWLEGSTATSHVARSARVIGVGPQGMCMTKQICGRGWIDGARHVVDDATVVGRVKKPCEEAVCVVHVASKGFACMAKDGCGRGAVKCTRQIVDDAMVVSCVEQPREEVVCVVLVASEGFACMAKDGCGRDAVKCSC